MNRAYIVPLKSPPRWQTLAWVTSIFIAAVGIWTLNHTVGQGWQFMDSITGAAFFGALTVIVGHHLFTMGGARIATSLSDRQTEWAIRSYEGHLAAKAYKTAPKPPAPKQEKPAEVMEADVDLIELTQQIAKEHPTGVAPALPSGSIERLATIQQPAPQAAAEPATAPLVAKPILADNPELKALVMAEVARQKQADADERWKE